jgi:hypothetical protein
LYKAWDVDSIVVGEKIAIGFEIRSIFIYIYIYIYIYI